MVLRRLDDGYWLNYAWLNVFCCCALVVLEGTWRWGDFFRGVDSSASWMRARLVSVLV